MTNVDERSDLSEGLNLHSSSPEACTETLPLTPLAIRHSELLRGGVCWVKVSDSLAPSAPIDILKNKVYSLLKAVETQGASTWNSLTRDANLFTAISGHLDSVAALKKLAEETRESDHEKVKLAAKAQKTAGLNLRDVMMKGHLC
ncbi:hypothetical protein BU17DRAFT_67761 [Hysterangium stoloniferum]|nr:hypothetical protein BU17DRAFT_67761 [Hysterangium stoloniferum]